MKNARRHAQEFQRAANEKRKSDVEEFMSKLGFTFFTKTKNFSAEYLC
jgi:hypothetical protein